MTEKDTEIKVKVKSWPEMVASADYVSDKGLHIGGFVYPKEFLAKFIAMKEVRIQMHMYCIWEAVDVKVGEHGAPCLILLQMICTEEENARAEKHLTDVTNKFNNKI